MVSSCLNFNVTWTVSPSHIVRNIMQHCRIFLCPSRKVVGQRNKVTDDIVLWRTSFPFSSIIEGLSALNLCREVSLGYHFAFSLIRAVHSYYPVWIKNVLVNCFNSHLYFSTLSGIAKWECSRAVSSSLNKISLPWPSFALPLWYSHLIRFANEVFLLLGSAVRPWPRRPVKSLLD